MRFPILKVGTEITKNHKGLVHQIFQLKIRKFRKPIQVGSFHLFSIQVVLNNNFYSGNLAGLFKNNKISPFERGNRNFQKSQGVRPSNISADNSQVRKPHPGGSIHLFCIQVVLNNNFYSGNLAGLFKNNEISPFESGIRNFQKSQGVSPSIFSAENSQVPKTHPGWLYPFVLHSSRLK